MQANTEGDYAINKTAAKYFLLLNLINNNLTHTSTILNERR
jgi:hypothetical protein